ncbi:MAG: tRNA (adenosine(37)-N6)-threonylcarbamoyltransferase complex ATPase subunit type 1 TsaE [Alphaproteobacteria bacterium]|nr:tRNA (adenosine(37)-N6)-threonylcarbamoyltransferase complex ATPase subunit type 1 TsaE [Alphaproteobacteria bacterium]
MSGGTLNIENEAALAALAARLAPLLKTGDVLALAGSLGAGKTAFARALIHALSPAAGEVPSPTFTLVQVYDLPGLSIWHFDLYRLAEKKQDILELGWDEARRFGVSLVEWPDRLGGLLPKDSLEINIAFNEDSENSRTVTLVPHGSWRLRLEGIKG